MRKHVLSRWIGRLFGWLLERLYRELAFAYEWVAWAVSAGRWAGWRRLAAPHLRGRRILEIGFGTGELFLTLREAGFDVSGADFSMSMALLLRRKLVRSGEPAGRITRARAQQLPYAHGAFDSVVFTFAAGYAMDPHTYVEVRRVLRPGGRLIVVDGGFSLPGRVGMALQRLLFGETDAGLLGYEVRIREAGFDVSIEHRDGRFLGVYIIIAEKPA